MNTSEVPGAASQIETFLHDAQLLMARTGHRMLHGSKLPLGELKAIQASLELLSERLRAIEQAARNEATKRGLKIP